ncbi:NUDIX domain-containing protein [Aeromicrobium sp. CTD01-1L150]|uniref:NUDIX domain-containing protein n=1 Tax=Aeromicrobium sp. CTD01-1L150 TaxID=3341830 RepID=UPI0035C0A97A
MSDHPYLPGRVVHPDDVRDRPDAWPVSDSTTHYDTSYLRLTHETIVAPDGSEHGRAVVRPHGAVAVLALDDDDRLLLVQQYRHPVAARLVELPAGTLDVAGESPEDAAARELAEEADVVARRWEPLLQLTATPGYSSERWQVFRASGLTAVPEADRTERQAEEAEIQQWWLPFDDAVDAALAGAFGDALSIAAVLAEQTRRSRA